MNEIVKVTKSDGTEERFDLEKIHKVLEWAVENITGVSISDIEMKAKFDLIDGVATKDIHQSLINAARDLVSETSPNYQFVASRLLLFKMRKQIYGSYTPWSLRYQLNYGVLNNKYTEKLLEVYTDSDLVELNDYIKHERDDKISYAGMKEFCDKYLVQDRKDGTLYETPQMCYMVQAMANYCKVHGQERRLELIKADYDAVSTFKVSLPTPIMAGLRTPVKQFSSCVVIDVDDTVDSIATTGSAINKYVARKAGIGINLGGIRPEHAKIRDGDAYHTGITPIARKMQADVKSFSQGGVRGGAATVFFPIWHLEIENILHLKNEKGTEFNRVRQLDYGIQFNTLLHKRLLSGGNISLFAPNEVPDLYDAFFADQEKFEELYLHYESICNTLNQYASIPAAKLYSTFQSERAETGRYYWMNVDHANVYGKFKPDVAPIKQSNLCLEITLPTRPLQYDRDPNGWIALCTLGAINMGEVKKLSDLESLCYTLVNKLDEIFENKINFFLKNF